MMEEPERYIAFRLALHFRIPDPEIILEKLPATLINQWLVFFHLLDGGLHFDIGDPDRFVVRSPQAIYDTLKDHLLR